MNDLRHKSKPSLYSNLLVAGWLAASALSAQAQTYTAVDLTPALPYSSATSLSNGTVAGFTSNVNSQASAKATLWLGLAQFNLHPALLDDGINAIQGRSAILGSGGNLQVGWGAGPATANRLVPLVWRGSPESASALTIPFTNNGGQATATDGAQIVGYATSLNRDGTTFGPTHALLWDGASGTAVDLGDGGNGAQALGVGGGQQVGSVVKSVQNAALWRGAAKSLVVLHPKNAVVSVALSTNGVNQVGYAGYDVRVRVEAVNGNKDKRFTYATVWAGNASSALNIHPFGFTHSYAVAIKGSWIGGYGANDANIGTPAYFHALIWDSNYQATDLHAFLPAQYVGSQALAVDESGNVSGVATTADGQRHAIVWRRMEP